MDETLRQGSCINGYFYGQLILVVPEVAWMDEEYKYIYRERHSTPAGARPTDDAGYNHPLLH